MTVFLSLLPIYIFGNLHCIGMCGPLVLMLGRHRFRHYYFLGRTLSFTIAGFFAGAMGAVSQAFLAHYHLSALISFFFGGALLAGGVFALLKMKPPIKLGIEPLVKAVGSRLTTLILMDRPFPVFLFGFFTLALPCGQTVIVFSALALEGSWLAGLVNGFMFALLTSPSLFLAMRAQNYFRRLKDYTQVILGICTVIVGAAALCRGLAETGIIPHLVLNPGASPEYHIALY